jgi:hypothetical protein
MNHILSNSTITLHRDGTVVVDVDPSTGLVNDPIVGPYNITVVMECGQAWAFTVQGSTKTVQHVTNKSNVEGVLRFSRKKIVVEYERGHEWSRYGLASIREMLPDIDDKLDIEPLPTPALFTSYSTNNLRILLCDERGPAKIFEIALVARHEKLYLTVQCAREFMLYRDPTSGDIRCPIFESGQYEWPSLMGYLDEHGPDPKDLPVYNGQVHEEMAMPVLKKGEAMVVWHNWAGGSGAVRTADGRMARFRWINVHDISPPHLSPGDLVKVTLERTPETSRTKFAWQCTTIEPIVS